MFKHNYRSIGFEAAGDITSAACIPPKDKILSAEARPLLNVWIARLVADYRGRGTSPAMCTLCMQHILERTFRFKKTIENITVAEFQNGNEALSIPGMYCSRDTVRKAINALVEDGLLIRIDGDYTKICLYAPHLPNIIKRISELMDRERLEKGANNRTMSTAQMHATRLDILTPICEKLQGYYETLASLSDDNWYKFTKKVKEFKARMTKLLNNMPEACKKSREGVRKSRENSANKSMFGKGGLNYWHLQVEARPDLFPRYLAKTTGKLSGNMTHLVKEWISRGWISTDDDEIRDKEIKQRIEDIIEGWSLIVGRSFDDSQGYPRKVPELPDFEFYFRYRAEIEYLLGTLQDADRDIVENAPSLADSKKSNPDNDKYDDWYK